MSEIVVTSTWRERLEALTGGRKEAWAVVGVVGAVVLGGLVLWVRGSSSAVAPPARVPAEISATVPAAAPTMGPTPPAGGVIYVHVAGAVRRPGLYELPASARVADAIAAARGSIAAADLNALNLAEPLADGQKVDVPRKGEAGPATQITPGASPSSGPVVNINTADQAGLEAIPEVGPVTAMANLEYRAQIGSFTSVEQLLEVSGIGPATLEAIRPYVTI